MKERLLTPKDVAERLGISISAARTRMREMPGCVNVGGGERNRVLRVPASGLEAWQSNRVILMPMSTGKIPRRHTHGLKRNAL